MLPQPRERNRGPAAAAANRAALLGAARRLFAQRGYLVPLSAIAKEAGVGQGVLYRHFPTRVDLAIAVFAENLVELEDLAAHPDGDTFARLWVRLVDQTVTTSAFIELVADARRSLAAYDGEERLVRLLEASLLAAVDAGTVDPGLTAAEVLMALRMVHGVVVTAPTQEDACVAVHGALRLLPPWASAQETRGRPASDSSSASSESGSGPSLPVR